jgi:hypothetical protein
MHSARAASITRSRDVGVAATSRSSVDPSLAVRRVGRFWRLVLSGMARQSRPKKSR